MAFSASLLLAATLVSSDAFARGGHSGGARHFSGARVVVHAPAYAYHAVPRARVFIGAPIIAAPLYYGPAYSAYPSYSPYYGPASSYYYPPTAYPATQYIEADPAQPAPAAEASANDYWYYCADAKAYYPYVKECNGGWQRVSPTPQS